MQPPDMTAKLSSKWHIIGLGLGIFVFIALYTYEFRFFTQTLGFRKILIPAIVLFGGLGAWLGYAYSRHVKDQIDRIRIQLALFIGCLILAPWLLSLSNRWLSFRGPETIKVVYAGEVPYIADIGIIDDEKHLQPDGYYLYFYWNDQFHQTKEKSPQYQHVEKGAEIELLVRRGLWGGYIVE